MMTECTWTQEMTDAALNKLHAHPFFFVPHRIENVSFLSVIAVSTKTYPL